MTGQRQRREQHLAAHSARPAISVRPVRLVVGVTVAALVAIVVAIGHDSTSGRRADGADAIVVSARSAAPAVTALAERLERPAPTRTQATLSLEFVVVAMIFAGLVGRSRRRIGDVGDRWRRLLVGAPPAAV